MVGVLVVACVIVVGLVAVCAAMAGSGDGRDLR